MRRRSCAKPPAAPAKSAARCAGARGGIAAVFAVPTGLVVFRLRGPYFAIGSWVVAEVYRLIFAQFKQLGGGTGASLPATNGIFGIQWVKAAFEVRAPAARDIITYYVL
jgi:branched-chain amino acid transport system permease protein